jgi:hypothetical protein
MHGRQLRGSPAHQGLVSDGRVATQKCKVEDVSLSPSNNSILAQVSRLGGAGESDTCVKTESARLVQQNAELLSKLAFLDQRVPGLARQVCCHSAGSS